ncbi:MAG: hypothetical protein ACTIJ2_06325 [Sphingobacteriaceae bacterium]
MKEPTRSTFMLIPDFYTIVAFVFTGDRVEAQIHLHAHHPVFDGHFPNNPITPGVCMIQIFKELAEKAIGNPLKIRHCKNVKFTALINPFTHPDLQITLRLISNGQTEYKLSGIASFGETQALKIQTLLSRSVNNA